jgi:hypothetical protein
MGSKIKGLRRKPGIQKVAPGKASVAGKDALMLSAAKHCVVNTEQANELAEGNVLVVCDLRDQIAAEIAAMSLRQTVDELRDAVLPGARPGEANPTPFVTTWGPRALLAPMLSQLGFEVPGDWAASLARAPRAPGWFWILLKRDGRGLLLESDLVDIPVLPVPAVAFTEK